MPTVSTQQIVTDRLIERLLQRQLARPVEGQTDKDADAISARYRRRPNVALVARASDPPQITTLLHLHSVRLRALLAANISMYRDI